MLFICMGNICRSPAAHAVMAHLNRERQLGWRIDSCGTNAYHSGAAPDARMQKVLQRHGYPKFLHASQLFRVAMAYEFDLLLAMDSHNYDSIYEHLCHDKALLQKLFLFREFDPQVNLQVTPAAKGAERPEVPDPYYGGADGFQEVYQMIVRTCKYLAER